MINYFSLFDILFAAGMGWGIFGFIIIFREKRNLSRVSAFEQSFILLCFVFSLLDHLIKPTLGPNRFFFFILNITRNIGYLTGPALWFYTRGLVMSNPLPRRRDFIHFLPFIFWFFLTATAPDLFPPFIAKDMSPANFAPSPLKHFHDISVTAISLAYCLFSLWKIRKHKGGIPDFYSRKDTFITLSWLRILLIAMVLLHLGGFLLSLVQTPLPPGGQGSFPEKSLILSAPVLQAFSAILFLFYFSVFSTRQGIPEDTRTDFKTEKYKNSGLDEERIDRVFRDLTEFMKKNKPYLNPDLTLTGLAEDLSLSRHHLSQIINLKRDQNFYAYINKYRVEELVLAIEENRYPSFTLKGIAYECGFRSASFYSLFKEETGVTPGEYLKKVSARNISPSS